MPDQEKRMDHKVILLLAIHNHQPVGNFTHVLESAYRKSYLPFLLALKEHQGIKVTLHYSGFLLEWLARTHPEFTSMIRDLVLSGRVEMMSGGFYEPILTTLYDSDKLGQIRKLNSFIRETFDTEARGMWLAERVWEPHLAEALYNAGAEYIVLDDHHFIMAGLRGRALFGYYITEEKGKILKVFPGSEKLRYLIPFHPVEETLAYLRLILDSGDKPLAVMGDDGEKFGTWPGTYHSVYEEGWLHRFFEAIEQNSGWIESKLFSEVIDTHPPLGRIYLPTSSYMEMGEWSLIYDASEEFRVLKQKLKDHGLEDMSRPFLSGGFWRNFFSKYPESNLMHKKMLYISEKIHHMLKGKQRTEALEELWKGQCNDAYWHGVFGGIYLPHLRSSIYEHLIRAEYIADQAMHPGEKGWIKIIRCDLDKDGINESIMNTERYTLIFDTHLGGTLMGMDFKPRSFNLQDTFTRVPEFYHRDIISAPTEEQKGGGAKSIHDRVISKEEGLADRIVYDRYPKRSLVDHFMKPDEGMESFRSGKHMERGDFVQGLYGATKTESAGEASVALERTGWVQACEGASPPQQVQVAKTVHGRAGDSMLTVRYRILNLSGQELMARFGIEWNMTLLAGSAADRYYLLNDEKPESSFLASAGDTDGIQSVCLTDEWKGIQVKISLDHPCSLWRFPVETVSLSEEGFEKIYQGSCLVLCWDIHLVPHAVFERLIRLEFCVIPDHEERELQSKRIPVIEELR